jgi:hypothetical protein
MYKTSGEQRPPPCPPCVLRLILSAAIPARRARSISWPELERDPKGNYEDVVACAILINYDYNFRKIVLKLMNCTCVANM